MVGFLKKLFGMADRSDKAADRIATAMERLADDVELLSSSFRERFGILDQVTSIPLPAVTTQPTEEEEVVKKGRKKIASA